MSENGLCYHAEDGVAQMGAACASIPVRVSPTRSLGRGAAARALGKMGSDAAPAVPALIECLKDGKVNYSAAEALERLDRQPEGRSRRCSLCSRSSMAGYA